MNPTHRTRRLSVTVAALAAAALALPACQSIATAASHHHAAQAAAQADAKRPHSHRPERPRQHETRPPPETGTASARRPDNHRPERPRQGQAGPASRRRAATGRQGLGAPAQVRRCRSRCRLLMPAQQCRPLRGCTKTLILWWNGTTWDVTARALSAVRAGRARPAASSRPGLAGPPPGPHYLPRAAARVCLSRRRSCAARTE
jgi:hypothetical protein